MPSPSDRKPIYVTSIDNEKFARIEAMVARPLAYLAVIAFGGIYCVALALMIVFGIYYL